MLSSRGLLLLHPQHLSSLLNRCISTTIKSSIQISHSHSLIPKLQSSSCPSYGEVCRSFATETKSKSERVDARDRGGGGKIITNSNMIPSHQPSTTLRLPRIKKLARKQQRLHLQPGFNTAITTTTPASIPPPPVVEIMTTPFLSVWDTLPPPPSSQPPSISSKSKTKAPIPISESEESLNTTIAPIPTPSPAPTTTPTRILQPPYHYADRTAQKPPPPTEQSIATLAEIVALSQNPTLEPLIAYLSKLNFKELDYEHFTHILHAMSTSNDAASITANGKLCNALLVAITKIINCQVDRSGFSVKQLLSMTKSTLTIPLEPQHIDNNLRFIEAVNECLIRLTMQGYLRPDEITVTALKYAKLPTSRRNEYCKPYFDALNCEEVAKFLVVQGGTSSTAKYVKALTYLNITDSHNFYKALDDNAVHIMDKSISFSLVSLVSSLSQLNAEAYVPRLFDFIDSEYTVDLLVGRSKSNVSKRECLVNVVKLAKCLSKIHSLNYLVSTATTSSSAMPRKIKFFHALSRNSKLMYTIRNKWTTKGCVDLLHEFSKVGLFCPVVFGAASARVCANERENVTIGGGVVDAESVANDDSEGEDSDSASSTPPSSSQSMPEKQTMRERNLPNIYANLGLTFPPHDNINLTALTEQWHTNEQVIKSGGGNASFITKNESLAYTVLSTMSLTDKPFTPEGRVAFLAIWNTIFHISKKGYIKDLGITNECGELDVGVFLGNALLCAGFGKVLGELEGIFDNETKNRSNQASTTTKNYYSNLSLTLNHFDPFKLPSFTSLTTHEFDKRLHAQSLYKSTLAYHSSLSDSISEILQKEIGFKHERDLLVSHPSAEFFKVKLDMACPDAKFGVIIADDLCDYCTDMSSGEVWFNGVMRLRLKTLGVLGWRVVVLNGREWSLKGEQKRKEELMSEIEKAFSK